LTVLWKIAVGLEIPFQALLEGPEDSGAKVLRASDVTPLRSADGRMESRLLSPGGSPPGLELYELRFQPKAVHRSDPHSKGTSETLVVLKGALRVVVGEAEYELLTGDSIFFTAHVTHVYENRASHEARCLDIINYGRAG
jgi:quercetin dioxygenase-like cupin family protein